MSSHKFIRKGTAPYQREGHNNMGYCAKAQGLRPVGWLLTPDQEPLLGAHKASARIIDPPIGFATRFLETLEGKGYQVISSHSNGRGKGYEESVTYMWTLKHVGCQVAA